MATAVATALRTPDTRGEVLGERGERTQAGRPVVGVVEQHPHEGRADDHAVGVPAPPRRPAPPLPTPRPDADGQVGHGAGAGDQRPGQVAGDVARAPVTPMTAVA